MNIKQADRISKVPVSKTRDIMAKVGMLEAKGRKIINLSIGQPDFPTPEYIKNAAKEALDNNFTGYPPVAGTELLRKAIADELWEHSGVSYDTDEIVVTTGVAQGIFISLMSFLNPGDEIILPDPGYNYYSATAKAAGAVIRTYDLYEENNFQIDTKQMEGLVNGKTKMLVLISPNNPVGSILGEKSLKEISEIIRERDIIVLSDEIYSRLSYGDTTNKSICSFPGMKEKSIILNGFSKYYSMTGWRLGYAAAPKELTAPMINMCSITTSGANSISQYAAVEALKNKTDDSCEKMRLELKRRCDYLYTELNKIENISCTKPEGSFYIFLNIKGTGLTSEEFSDRLLNECGVAVVPGTAFGSNGEGFVRLSFASSYENLAEAVMRIKSCPCPGAR